MLSSIDLSGCGISKGCYRLPSNCQQGACDKVFTWKQHDTFVDFQVEITIDPNTEKDNPWIAAGFSNNTKMV